MGKTIAQLYWTEPTLYENYIQIIGQVASDWHYYYTKYAPMQIIPRPIIAEITDLEPIGAPSATSLNQINPGDNAANFSSVVGFTSGMFIRIGAITEEFSINKINSIDGSKVIFASRIETEYPISTEIVAVDHVFRVRSVDYQISETTGQISLILPGPWTVGNYFIVECVPLLEEIGKYKIVMVPGNEPVIPSEHYSGIDYLETLAAPGAVVIDDDILAGNEGYADILATEFNGETVTYYLFVEDIYGNTSFGQTYMIETLPSIPQFTDPQIDDETVLIHWEELPVSSDANTDGFNLYRNEGAEFSGDDAVKLNDSLIASSATEFLDHDSNVDRDNTIPNPENGVTYSYKMEAEDTDTFWTTGTQNEVLGQMANYVAEK